MNSPYEKGRSYDGGMLDITGAKDIQIQIAQAMNGKIIWVNIDSICVLRICRILGQVQIENQINETKSIV